LETLLNQHCFSKIFITSSIRVVGVVVVVEDFVVGPVVGLAVVVEERFEEDDLAVFGAGPC